MLKIFNRKRKQKRSKRSEQSAQNLMSVRYFIGDGLYVTDEDYLCTLIRFDTVNADLMSKRELEDLLQQYSYSLQSLHFNFQFLILSKAVDMEDYIEPQHEMLYEDDITRDRIGGERSQLLHSYIEYAKEKQQSVQVQKRYIVAYVKLRGYDEESVEQAKEELRNVVEIITENIRAVRIQTYSVGELELVQCFQSIFNYGDSIRYPITQGQLDNLSSVTTAIKEEFDETDE